MAHKLPVKYPTMVLTSLSLPALQQILNDLGNELVLITNAVNMPVTGRPTGQSVGDVSFDTQLGIPIWWNGTAWVNATGAPV